MFSRKLLLLAAAAALLVGGSFFAYTRYVAVKAPIQPVISGFMPQIPDAPALLLMDEKSGEISRQVVRDNEKNQISSIEVGYKDGRTGKYLFKDGKLRFYKAFNEDGKLFYEAEYEPTGLLVNYKYLRSDGSTETLFRRLPDGSDELIFLNKDAYVTASVVTTSDGAQSRSSRPNPLEKPELSKSKAEPNERNFLPITLEDESSSYQLKVKLVGMRISEWEYRDEKGLLIHTGKFASNGNLEINVLKPDGKPGFKQTWVCIGEDWSRRFYRLISVEGFNAEGKTAALITFYPDGKTPKEIAKYSYGYKSNSDLYDAEGYLYQQNYYDSNGTRTFTWNVPPQSKRQAELPAMLTDEPGDKNGAIYRFKGTPYSSRVPAQGSILSPLFVLPPAK